MEASAISGKHTPSALLLLFPGGRGLLLFFCAVFLSGCFGSSGDRPQFAIGGTVNGLEGSGLVLQSSAGDDLVVDADGAFVFSRTLHSGDAYTVTVDTQPGDPAQTCEVDNASGEVGTSDIDNIAVHCTTNPALEARSGIMQMHLAWGPQDTVDILVSSDPDCDWANYILCENGRMLTDQSGGELTLEALADGFDPGSGWYFVARDGPAFSEKTGARPAPPLFSSGTPSWFASGPRSGSVNTGVIDGDRLYVGGRFTQVAMPARGGVEVTADQGEPVGPLLHVDGRLHAVVPDGEGGWYIGGQFERVGGVFQRNLARIRADGSLDPTFRPKINDGAVLAIQRFGDVVYAGGSFRWVTGQRHPHMVVVDSASGELDQARTIAPDAPVKAFAADQQRLYAGGEFTAVGDSIHFHLVAIDPLTGTPDPEWAARVDGHVNDLALQGGRLYVGGRFNRAGEATREYLAAFASDTGELDEAWRPLPPEDEVWALAATEDRLYVGGEFSHVGRFQFRVEHRYLTAYEAASGRVVMDWDSGIGDGFTNRHRDRVDTLLVAGDRLYAAGWFLGVAGEPRDGLVALDKGTGTLVPEWNPEPNGKVFALSGIGDRIYIGGQFSGINPVPRLNLAAFDVTTGRLDMAWHPDANDDVEVLLAANDRIYAGGRFTQIGGQPRAHLAAFDAVTGALDPDWIPEVDGGSVRALLESDNRIIAGGFFNQANGESRERLAAFDAVTGTLDPDWAPQVESESAYSPRVYSLLAANGRIYAGGLFDMVDGESREHLAAFDPGTGTLDPGWAPGVMRPLGSASISSLIAVDDRIHAGGWFDEANGEPRAGLAAFDATSGTLDPEWAPQVDSASVSSLAVLGDWIYTAGGFSQVDASPRQSLARVDAVTGAVDPAWDPVAGLTGSFARVLDISAQRIYLGGRIHIPDTTLAVFDLPPDAAQP